MKNYFWSRKSADPAKKINKYSIFYRNEGKLQQTKYSDFMYKL